MLKNKKTTLFLIIIYFALFLNTGHLCLCNDIDPQTGICNCCEHSQNSMGADDCDCCLSIKTDAAKLAAESLFDANDLFPIHQNLILKDIFNNLISQKVIKSYEQSYAPFQQNTDKLKTVILLN